MPTVPDALLRALADPTRRGDPSKTCGGPMTKPETASRSISTAARHRVGGATPTGKGLARPHPGSADRRVADAERLRASRRP